MLIKDALLLIKQLKSKKFEKSDYEFPVSSLKVIVEESIDSSKESSIDEVLSESNISDSEDFESSYVNSEVESGPKKEEETKV